MKTIMEMARDCGINFHQAGWPELERFAELVREEAIAETNARANASWTLMCEKMVAFEREACAKVVKPDNEAYTALEQALTRLQKRYGELEAKVAAQQQPVGYVAENGVVDWNVCAPPILTNLYTTPPQRKPLTEEVKNEFWIEAIKHGINGQSMNWQKAADFYADAIEAAHGITGEQK